MRHGKKFNHLGRKTAHRKAMLSNMACSLIEHKSINTTIAKAKALRGYVEPLLTKSKVDSTHSRRVVFGYLQNKEAVTELFREVAPKIADRPGGYTRIIRTGYRLGDNAEMCMIELVDFNELYTNEKTKKVTRRSRRGGGSAGSASSDSIETVEVVEDAKAEETPSAKVPNETEEVIAEVEVAEETPVVEEVIAEVEVAEETPVVEEAVAEVEEVTEETPVIEEVVAEVEEVVEETPVVEEAVAEVEEAANEETSEEENPKAKDEDDAEEK